MEPIRTFRQFATISDAREYRRVHGTGGYIFAGDDGSAVYLFPAGMTATPVMTHPLLRGIDGTLI